MTQPLTAFAVRDTADSGTIWTRIGVAFTNKSGFTLLLDAMPAPELGQYKIVVLPPRQNEVQESNGRPAAN